MGKGVCGYQYIVSELEQSHPALWCMPDQPPFGCNLQSAQLVEKFPVNICSPDRVEVCTLGGECPGHWDTGSAPPDFSCPVTAIVFSQLLCHYISE